MKRLFPIAFFAAATLLAQSPAGDAKHGKELFLNYGCYSCHSFDGSRRSGRAPGSHAAESGGLYRICS
jgi:mono/diheme cytochrome c family protein